MDGEDVFAEIKENSLSGDIVSELAVDTTAEGVQWSLVGKDADWFFLDGKNIRLNVSEDKILDREVSAQDGKKCGSRITVLKMEDTFKEKSSQNCQKGNYKKESLSEFGKKAIRH